MGKKLAEKYEEVAERAVPDETLTVAWWDLEEVARDAQQRDADELESKFADRLGAAVGAPQSWGNHTVTCRRGRRGRRGR
jgi:hypothetical protein